MLLLMSILMGKIGKALSQSKFPNVRQGESGRAISGAIRPHVSAYMGQTGRAVQWGLHGGVYLLAPHFAMRTTSGDGGIPGGMGMTSLVTMRQL